jgi:hypothetical protein
MRAFILLITAVLSLSAFASETASDKASQTEVSPWAGEWAGSENSSVGQVYPLTVDIKVTGDIISGTWMIQGGELEPITGRVKENADEASITILQGGSTVDATMVDENTFKYQGLRGYGTLTRE